jgi:hypothetical protein
MKRSIILHLCHVHRYYRDLTNVDVHVHTHTTYNKISFLTHNHSQSVSDRPSVVCFLFLIAVKIERIVAYWYWPGDPGSPGAGCAG